MDALIQSEGTSGAFFCRIFLFLSVFALISSEMCNSPVTHLRSGVGLWALQHVHCQLLQLCSIGLCRT